MALAIHLAGYQIPVEPMSLQRFLPANRALPGSGERFRQVGRLRCFSSVALVSEKVFYFPDNSVGVFR